ncbi:MAG: hydrolase glyoxylase, partial [Cyanobacteria bacterium J06659_2]
MTTRSTSRSQPINFTPINFTLPQAAPGSLDVRWIHGSVSPKHNTDPDIQVHAYNEHTIIMRQNMAVHPEAPFMFLLFG